MHLLNFRVNPKGQPYTCKSQSCMIVRILAGSSYYFHGALGDGQALIVIISADIWIAHPVGIVIIPPVLVLHVQLLPHMQPSLLARPRHCVVQYEGDD